MNSANEIVIYQQNDAVSLEVLLDEDTVWLTQAQMADLFQRDRSVITKHIEVNFYPLLLRYCSLESLQTIVITTFLKIL